jgi:hypothetical protein
MLGEQSVLLSGERWAESEQRSHVLPWEWREAICLKPSLKRNATWPRGWRMLWARPGIALALHEVARAVIAAGIEPHIGYFDQGETLASLLDPHRDERAPYPRALDTRPAVMGPAVEAILNYERVTGYSWQQRGPLGLSCG